MEPKSSRYARLLRFSQLLSTAALAMMLSTPDPGASAASSALPAAVPGSVRPALPGNPMQYTQRDLVLGGYPLRPDPKTSPSLYAKWLNRVAIPLRIDITTTINRPDLKAQVEGNPWWSGYGLTPHYGESQFTAAAGEWVVPAVAPHISGTELDENLWVGIDRANGLVQAGTWQSINPAGTQRTLAWVEVPLYESAQEISGITISPFDLVEVLIYVGNGDGTINVRGNYVWFAIVNWSTSHTTGWLSRFYLHLNRYHVGDWVEYILERPTVNGNPDTFLLPYNSPALYTYSALYPDGTSTQGTSGEGRRFFTAIGQNTGNVLSSSNFADSTETSIQCWWSNYH